MCFRQIFLIFFLYPTLIFAQQSEYSVTSIPDSLKENANAIVRLNQIDIVVASQRSMNIKNKRVVTVFNENGLDIIDAIEGYDKRTSVKSIEAVVYDSFGNEIKKIKRKDFTDQSAFDGYTLFSDNRILFLKYTPTQYPFTISYESEVETSTTAHIPNWMPISNFYESIEKSVLNVTCLASLGFKKKEFNFDKFKIQKKTDSNTQLTFIIENIPAQKPENLIAFSKVLPKMMMGLESFNLEGVDGSAKNWKEYGKWFSENILTGTNNLSEETKTKIKALVGTETDPIKKAQIVYKYMQGKTRYISVQVGIGGFKPMLANDVDRLGYGDCKALSNYTRSLLEVVGVPSYYTELFGDSDIRNIESDFTSLQGNHVILCVPNGTENVFLECTSQDNPFGYQAYFTDDRDVLVIKPEGGEIIHTKIYDDKGNTQISRGSYKILENGDFEGKISIVSEGAQYNQKARIEKLQPTEKEAHYKDYWSNINNLKIDKITFINDKENIRFTENAEIQDSNYGNLSGDKMIFSLNAFNSYMSNVKRIRSRKAPFEIQRGYMDNDEIEIALPAGFTIEFLPGNYTLNSKFGNYKTEIMKKGPNDLIYKRTFIKSKGSYTNTEYDEYRFFTEQVSKYDNSKIVLTKI